MRAGSAQLRQRLRLRLHQAHWQGLLVPRHSPNSAVPTGNLLLLRKHKAKQAKSPVAHGVSAFCHSAVGVHCAVPSVECGGESKSTPASPASHACH
jgi:hypothetical protein